MVSITSKSLRVAAEAMAIADEMEGAISSFGSKPAEIKQGTPDVLPLEDMLSLEDIAWADSCLIKDRDISQIDWNSWNSFRDALTETLSSETGSSAASKENCPEAVIEISPSSQQIGTSQILGPGTDVESSITEGAVKNSEDQLNNENTDIFQSEMNLENIFLPTWNECLENFGAPDTEEDVNFPGFVMEQSTGDIFKVWDLGLPAEEDEFINQLNKALAQSSLEPSPSVSDDSELLRGLKDIAIDGITSGMSDLSLNRSFI